MASPRLNLRIEPELDVALRAAANQQNAEVAELARVILRVGLGVTDLREAAYREGKLLAYREHRERLERAHHAAGVKSGT